MTPEELRTLQEAGTLDELVELLKAYLAQGKISQDEAADLYDQYGIILEAAGDVINPQGGVGTEPYGPAEATDPIDQYLTDPGIKAYLGAYTSAEDLANRISNLLGQGIIPDEATAGGIYNRILGKVPDRKELDALEADRFAPPEALEAAQKRYEAAQAALNQEAGMFIRAGTARGAERAYESEVQRVEGLNLMEQLRYKGQVRESERQVKEEQAALNAPRIAAVKASYLPSLRIALDNAVKAGSITQGQANQQWDYENSLIDRGFDLRDLPNYAPAKAQLETTELQKQGTELQRLIDLEQRNLAPKIREANRQAALQELLGRSEEAGLERLLKERQFQAAQPKLPEQPSYASVYEPFLAGLAPNFRRFIESRLGRIAEETEGARAAWWRERNPEQPMPDIEQPVPTFESLLAGARRDLAEREDILRSGQLGASTTGGAGGYGQDYSLTNLPYWTEQKGLSETRLADLLALGQEGYFAQQRALPKDEPLIPKRAPTTAPDPFKAALESYPFLETFMKLSPAERGYQKQRFAPRVQWRGM